MNAIPDQGREEYCGLCCTLVSVSVSYRSFSKLGEIEWKSKAPVLTLSL